MDFASSTEQSPIKIVDLKISQENTLLEMLKELCRESDNKLSAKLKKRVTRIIADSELKYHTSLQRVSTADESTSTVLGFMHQIRTELSYDEQADLNQALIDSIEKKLPAYINDLEKLKKSTTAYAKHREDQLKELTERDKKMDTLQEQENEQMELMMEWLNHRLQGIAKYGDNSSELLNLRVKIMNLKSKILHLQILQNIFTETNQSIRSYSEIHKDLKDSIKETEQRIKTYKDIIEKDFQ